MNEEGIFVNIALIAHDKKKELMVQFCIAYSGILSKTFSVMQPAQQVR